MELIELSFAQISQIEDLWNELNSLHAELSTDFKQHFASSTFTKRCESLAVKEEPVSFVARVKERPIGYCIESVHQGRCEIDSLYVQQEYRGENLGEQLLKLGLRWLEQKHCKQIYVYVAEGNEAALPFYERVGFKKRSQVLQIRNDN